MLKRCFLGDLRRSAGLYILIAAVLTVMGVLAVNLSGFVSEDIDGRIIAFYDDDRFYDIVSCSASTYEDDRYSGIADEDIEIKGRYLNNFTDIQTLQGYMVMEKTVVDLFWMPLSDGNWFDGTRPQAIVPESMAAVHPIGSVIQINTGEGATVEVAVVGYSENDGVIASKFRSNDEIDICPFIRHNSERITICVDSVEPFCTEQNDWALGYLFEMDEDEVNYLQEKYHGLSLYSMGDEFDNYLYRLQPFIALNIYMLYAMVAGCIVVAVTISVSAGEVNRRRLGVTMLCGATRRDLMICEAIRGAVCAVIAIAVTAVLGTTFGESEMLKMAPEDIWKGVLAILATGAVICAAGVIRIAKTKILDLINGR